MACVNTGIKNVLRLMSSIVEGERQRAMHRKKYEVVLRQVDYLMREWHCTRCFACNDPCNNPNQKFQGKPVCSECYEELVLGKVANHHVSFFGEGSIKAEDDIRSCPSSMVFVSESELDDWVEGVQK